MSEIVVEPSEGDDPLMSALAEFTAAMGEAVPDICSYGLTIGDSYVPFDPDEDGECDADDAVCSQVWVRVTDVSVQQGGGWSDDCSSVMNIGLEVGVMRCIEIASGGEAPTASEVLAASMQAMGDMKALYCAAMAAEVWAGLDVGQWTPIGPAGGQYGGVWNFTAEI